MMQYENHELKRLDAEIAALEARIAFKQEQRREIINRKDLNKNEVKIEIVPGVVCVHRGLIIDGKCQECGSFDISSPSPIASEWSAR